MNGKVAVIAGEGDLPQLVIGKLEAIGREYEFIPLTTGDYSIGEVGKIMNRVKQSGAKKILFCGSIKRPSFFKIETDSLGKEWIKKLGFRLFLGDDSLLKGVKKLLSENGLEIISPQSILEKLITPAGNLTIKQPSEREVFDIARGIFVLNSLARADVGQAVVVQDGVVIGIEAIEGTKNLILRSKNLKISREGGVLVKTAKTKQDLDVDLPTIGPNTVHECVESELSGIAVGHSVTQIINFEKTVKLANENNIFIVGV